MAGNPRRRIRKVPNARVADFDEQLWPIHVAVLILAGFAAGIVAATSDFRDPRLLWNGWVRLGVVAMLAGVSFWAVLWLQGKVLRRVQFCVLVSLAAHVWLGMVLHDHYLAMVAIEEARHADQTLRQPEPITIPDYHWDGLQPLDTRQSFEHPVQTASPAASPTEPVAEPVEKETPVTVPQPAEPETPPPEQPDPVEIRRAELSAPRRAELAAGEQISRQPWKYRSEPDEPIPQPAIQPEGRRTPSTLHPQVAAVERRRQPPAFQRQTFYPQPSARRRQDAVKPARRTASSHPRLEVPTTPTPTRQLDRPADVPRAEAVQPGPIRVVRRPAPPAPQPKATAARRQRDVPDPVPRVPEPAAARQFLATAGPPALPSAIARRNDASSRRPADDFSRPSRPSTVARSRRGATLPSAALAAEQLATPAAAGTAPASRLDISRSLAVKRSGQEALQGPTLSAAGTEEFAAGSAALAARTGQPRASGSGRPSVVPNAEPPRIARSPQGTPAPVTPQPQADEAASLVAASGRGGPASPSVDAEATALGRAGSVGIPSRTPGAVGLGPAAIAGASGRAGAIRLARVAGTEPRLSVQPGGGTPRPARTVGRALAGEARAELTQPAPAAPSGGRTAGPELDARPSGQERPVAGLPGSLAAQLAGGAMVAMTAGGAPRRTAAARRAPASQTESASAEVAPAAVATLARTRRATDLPAAAVVVEHVATAGAGGLAASRGSATSRLEVGANTTVRRVSPDVPAARSTLAAGSAEFGSGAADVVAMTSPAATTGETSLAGEPAAQDRRSGGSPGDAAPSARLASGSSEGPAATTPGTTPGPRRPSPGEEPGPALAVDVGGGPVKKTASPGLLRGLAVADRADAAAAAEDAEPGDFDVAAGPELGGPSRREGGLPVHIAAAAGPGGLSFDPAPVVGIPSRRARPESEVVYPASRRFVLERTGGRLTLDGRVRQPPAEMFRQRAPERRAESARKFGGSEGTERAVEAGLDFLARQQFPDGRWAIDRFPNAKGPEYDAAAPGQMHSDTAATGLALLAFLGAGYTHQEEKHQAVVRRGLDWLIGNQQPGGQLFNDQSDPTRYARSYAHGIAAIALCEAYGMTRDPELRRPAEKAIQYIYDSQHPELGGWRYTPHDAGGAWIKESDTSVSGWQLMALKSAEMAGLPVRAEVLEKVSGWLDSAEAAAGSRYVYNPGAADTPEQRRGLVPNRAMTAEGLLMRMYLGWRRDNPALVEGADFLKANLPEVGTAARPLRDCYYWYYATQVMFHMQGDYWDAWNGRLHPLLEASQLDAGPLAGSWNPDRPLPDRWGHAGGRLYVTAMNLLMLEVYYRHLPLFQTLR